MTLSLENALRQNNAEAADAAISAGERLGLDDYFNIFNEAQNREALETLRWFERNFHNRQIQELFHHNLASSSSFCWVAVNALLYGKSPVYDDIANLVIGMAARGGVINDPIVRSHHDATTDYRMRSAGKEGWRLLHAAAAAGNTALIQKLLSSGAHPNGFDPSVLAQSPKTGRFAQWQWAPCALKAPLCAPALLCSDSVERLEALAHAGADFSTAGSTQGLAAPASPLLRSLSCIRAQWSRGSQVEALALAAFWLDRASSLELSHLASDPRACPAEGMARLKGLSAPADAQFPATAGGALDRARFHLTAFERRFARLCVNASRRGDFFALASALRRAKAEGLPFDQWIVGDRHILMIALSFNAALPERERHETLAGAAFDRDQQTAALIDLAADLGGARSVFTPFAGESGSLAHYCALGFGRAANQACAALASQLDTAPLRLAENPLNWALWSRNEAALAAWTSRQACDERFCSLFPSSKPPFELALETGAIEICQSLAQAGCSLDRPSSISGRSLKELLLVELLDSASSHSPSRLALLRETLADAERFSLDASLLDDPAPTPRRPSL